MKWRVGEYDANFSIVVPKLNWDAETLSFKAVSKAPSHTFCFSNDTVPDLVLILFVLSASGSFRLNPNWNLPHMCTSGTLYHTHVPQGKSNHQTFSQCTLLAIEVKIRLAMVTSKAFKIPMAILAITMVTGALIADKIFLVMQSLFALTQCNWRDATNNTGFVL